jgi:DNA-binding MarR family transcriptional regulator
LSSQPLYCYRFKRVSKLSDAEAELWHAWKRASDSVMSRIGHDLTETTGLSGADYGVLSRLVDLGRGTLRQQDLANSMLWQKSRLSHHLSRMAQRQLVRRTSAKANVVLVVITRSGRQALRAARPIHARAIRAHLLGKIPRASRRPLLELLTRLSEA